jgi:hypothetical protein
MSMFDQVSMRSYKANRRARAARDIAYVVGIFLLVCLVLVACAAALGLAVYLVSIAWHLGEGS